ncbi:hypothetical protein PCNPT3_05570 [Psychromonas sp. CNPT3]|uniref:FUSC family protein n=1 Tax=Psychromonas sp. CNPT3 TaxID=314282 RepID=UPI00006E4236|nr:FUSC family protein [Psychromonas sp. CNPT3]AGH81056.1 hypothetical protein PCNPT3_05570 [Psychromonas sp. CNPT3]
MAKKLHFMTSIFYHPAVNFSSRVSTLFFLIFGAGWLTDHLMFSVIAASAIPAALISGIDQPNKDCCKHLLILSLAWGLAILSSYTLMRSDLPIWLVFFLCGFVFSLGALNGEFWNRLGSSCLFILVMVFFLFSKQSPTYQYALLVLGPALFSLLSWLWFSIWRHIVLRSALSTIYVALADYIYLRQCALLGESLIKIKLNKQKHLLVGLISQAFQSSSLTKKEDPALIKSLYVANEMFELALTGHSMHPDLHKKFKDPICSTLLVNWSDALQQRLRSLAIAVKYKRTPSSQTPIIEAAQRLVHQVVVPEYIHLQFWGRSILLLSKLVDINEPRYLCAKDIEVSSQSWHWPTWDLNLLKYAGRIALMLALGADIAQYFELLRPDWVVLCILMVIKSDFLATRSRIFERCLGTLYGLAFAVIWIELGVSDPVLIVLMIVLLPISFFLYMINYMFFMAGISAFIVLVFELILHQGLSFVLPRLLDTLIGASIVYLGYSLLWPQWRGKEIHHKSIESIQAVGGILAFTFNSLRRDAAQEVDKKELTQVRRNMFMSEHAWELVLKEMQQEPVHTHMQSDYYEQLLQLHRQLVHYLTVLSVLIREGARYKKLGIFQQEVQQAVDALIVLLRTKKETEFPSFSQDHDRYYDAESMDQNGVRSLLFLSVSTLKKMHEISLKHLCPNIIKE